jgi:hypothetical protein
MNTNTLDRNDLNMVIRRLPKELVELLKQVKWKNKIFLGGGFIRGVIANEKINDIDLFCSNKEDANLFAGVLSKDKKGNDIIKTENAITLKGRTPIQIITRWLFEKPEDVALSFDFTVCCAVVWFDGEKWCSFTDDRFYIDLSSKRLVYRIPIINEDAGGSMLRVLKYYQRGYRIPLDSLGSVIARLMKGVELSLIRDGLKDEEQVGKVITGLLRVVDPNIDVNHDSHLPSNQEDVEI